MDYWPTIELLEATHNFPTPFAFKAIGLNASNFVGRVTAAVCSHVDEKFEPDITCRRTAGGRHVAVTVETQVESAHQILDVYAHLRRLDGLVYLL